AFRRAVRDDAGRPRAQHRLHRLPDVRRRLHLVEHGLCDGGGVRALRHHARGHASPVPAAQRRGFRMSTTTQKMLLYAVLIPLALLVAFPLVWMVLASLMPPGAAST